MGVIGWSLVAAVFCALGIVLQQKGAMEAPPANAGGFLRSILSKPVWLAGLAVVVLLIVFGVFWMVTDPHGLAQSAHKAGVNGAQLTGDFFAAVITFIREIE